MTLKMPLNFCRPIPRPSWDTDCLPSTLTNKNTVAGCDITPPTAVPIFCLWRETSISHLHRFHLSVSDYGSWTRNQPPISRRCLHSRSLDVGLTWFMADSLFTEGSANKISPLWQPPYSSPAQTCRRGMEKLQLRISWDGVQAAPHLWTNLTARLMCFVTHNVTAHSLLWTTRTASGYQKTRSKCWDISIPSTWSSHGVGSLCQQIKQGERVMTAYFVCGWIESDTFLNLKQILHKYR